MTEPIVAFHGVGKSYHRGRERVNFRAVLPGRLGERRGSDRHWAVRDITFEIESGESLGIVGPNGAGKSTLLKLVAHVISPTCGDVHVAARSASLIELGAGFHPDMTGRENIYFSAAVLGMGPKDIRRRFDSIVDFAGIGAFLDTPVKRYSTGMMARLGFAVAAHLDVELIVLDEVLAVGDASFQRRCHERIAELRREGAALLYVTHALWTLPQLCDQAILLMQGEVQSRGSPSEVLRAYEERRDVAGAAAEGEGEVFGSIRLDRTSIGPGDSIQVQIDMVLSDDRPNGRLLVIIAKQETYLASVDSDSAGIEFRRGTSTIICDLPSLPFQPGDYVLGVVFFGDRGHPVFDDARQLRFIVTGDEVNPALGSTHIRSKWTNDESLLAKSTEMAHPAGDAADSGVAEHA